MCSKCKLQDVCGTMISNAKLIKAGYCKIHNNK